MAPRKKNEETASLMIPVQEYIRTRDSVSTVPSDLFSFHSCCDATRLLLQLSCRAHTK
jgi:hypothetical protein